MIIMLNVITHDHRYHKYYNEIGYKQMVYFNSKPQGVLNMTPSTLRLLPSAFLTRQSHLLEEIKIVFLRHV